MIRSLIACLHPCVLLAALTPFCAVGCERSAPSEKNARNRPIDGRGLNVLLVSIDNTRADSLACYGNKTIKTPNIDRLAAEGTRFDQCVSSAPITLPSHSTMMTGCYQYVHGARDNGLFKLAAENTTLGEMFKNAGYATHAVVGAMVLNRRYGLDQGFDSYDDLQRREGRAMDVRLAEPTVDEAASPQDADADQGAIKDSLPWASFDRRADEVARKGLDLLTQNKDRPFFIFLHFFDPHQPIRAPARFVDHYADDYLAEVAFVDEQFGLLMDKLRELGLAEKTLVILTSDHGEGRGEHGEQTHSYFLYDSTQRVPLILWCPARIPPGKTIRPQVRLIDLAPTIADFTGFESTPQMQGTSLLPLLLDPSKDPNLPAYADTLSPQVFFDYAPLRSLRIGGWKYVHAPVPELYDLANDPLEVFNLARAEPQRVEAMREQLRTLIAESPDPPASRAYSKQMTDEEIRQLQAIGYLAGGGSDDADDALLAGTELDHFEPTGANPADNKEAIELMNTSLGMLLSGRYKEAETMYRRLLELAPNNVKATKELADSLAAQNRLDEAEEVYRKAIELDPTDAVAQRSLGRVLLATGDVAGAEIQYRLAMNVDPADYGAHVLLGNLLARQRRIDEALAEFEAAVTLAPGVPAVFLQWGLALKITGRLNEAEAKLRKACELDAGFAEPRLALAQLLSERHKFDDARDELLAILKTDPNHLGALEMLAAHFARLGDYKTCDEYRMRAAQLDPEGPRGHFNRGLSLAMGGKHEEAIEQLRKATELEPTMLRAHMSLIDLLERMGRSADAIQACERLLEAVPRHPTVFTFVASTLERQGQRARAIEVLRKGSAAFEGDPDIANDLAWRLATCPEAEWRNGYEAARIAEHAREVTDGKNVNVLDTLAAAYAEVGRFDEAVEIGRHAMEAANQNGDTALAGRIAVRVESYEKREPYRDVSPPPPTDSQAVD